MIFCKRNLSASFWSLDYKRQKPNLSQVTYYLPCLTVGRNPDREAENPTSGYIQVTCWIDTDRGTLWLHCRTWCERAWSSHVGLLWLSYVSLCLSCHLNCSMAMIAIPVLGWSALHCITTLMVSVNIFLSFSSLSSQIHSQWGLRWHTSYICMSILFVVYLSLLFRLV